MSAGEPDSVAGVVEQALPRTSVAAATGVHCIANAVALVLIEFETVPSVITTEFAVMTIADVLVLLLPFA
jgi:hypothetical protein